MAQKNNNPRWPQIQDRLFHMVSVGIVDEPVNQAYDILSTSALIINLIASILYTFSSINRRYGVVLQRIEAVTVFFFAIDYLLRLLTARCLYPGKGSRRAVLKYMLSAAGIIDLLSFLPYYLPFFFPAGAAAFRMFRVARILRLFRINAYYDSLNVITEVLSSKKQQLMSSVFIILILMIASSLCMYSLEHEAQPTVFSNAFSGIWWSVSTLLTVGYGDIYPVTPLGKFFGIIISFLGVGMVAIPTGIISAGFVEQYSRLKRLGDYASEEDIQFIRVQLTRRDKWNGKPVKSLDLPHTAIVAAIQRDEKTLIPRGDVTVQAGDVLIIGAESTKGDKPMNLKEIVLRKQHPWNGLRIQELDISRQAFIVLVKRRGKSLLPRAELVLREGDTVILYSKANTLLDDVFHP